MTKLSQKFNFIEVEKKLQEYWQDSRIYFWQSLENKENSYIIDTPPPTVSGNLHIGHIFSYNHTDFIARYKRMSGMNVFYPMGFDDNGLPTERLVEKQKSIRAKDLKREDFIDICRKVIEIEEENFKQLFISIGLSVDWNYQYQTISDKSRQISQMSFLDLIQKGQIYRGFDPVLWDVVDQTALAQAEIEDKEFDSAMYDIKFTLQDKRGITIATTRPELLPACVAVLYNPADKRYNAYKNLHATTPLFGVKVPLIADDKVDIEKGTGLVMCCTFGDSVDVAWWRQHKLETRIIINKYGKIAPLSFEEISNRPSDAQNNFDKLLGLKVKEARVKIIEMLKEESLITKEVAIKHNVKCAERSGAPLEILVTPQWFVKSIEHKNELLERSEELNWYPKSMKIKLDSWINSISWDWCISRQRYFGVPFPAWYSKRAGEEGKILFASLDQLPVDPMVDLPIGYLRDDVDADMDVMDTWATSAVSPQLSAWGISDDVHIDKDRYKQLFPADLRPQAHEILRTWAFSTILKSHLHAQTLPWKNIMISGWCLASDKSKMSKSKGEIIKPQALIEKYGADVIRYWASNSRLGADTTFSEEIINNGTKLVNKLWNAARFIELHFEKAGGAGVEPLEKITHNTDKMLLSIISQVINNATKHFENYEYCQAREVVEKFFWQDFCDNYLEIIKNRIYDENGLDEQGKQSAISTLNYSFAVILKLFAPFMPYVTEELHKVLYNSSASIHARFSWPDLKTELISDGAGLMWNNFVEILNIVRKVKSAKNLSIKVSIKSIEIAAVQGFLPQDSLEDLKNVTNATSIMLVENICEDAEVFEMDGAKIGVIL